VKTFKATESFWKGFYALPPEQKESVRQAWKTFKEDPFHPSLGTHRIHRLTALYKTNVFSVVIEGDLRALFIMDGDTFTTLDIGTHAIYR
jgi:hypothetical protein